MLLQPMKKTIYISIKNSNNRVIVALPMIATIHTKNDTKKNLTFVTNIEKTIPSHNKNLSRS